MKIKKHYRGFTLIELLVVIAILGLLVSIVFSIGSSVIYKSQVKQTQGTILTLMSACNQYKNIYYYYPDLEHQFKDKSSDGKVTYFIYSYEDETEKNFSFVKKEIEFTINSTDKEEIKAELEDLYKKYNARLVDMLENLTYIKDEVRYEPFIDSNLPKVEEKIEYNTGDLHKYNLYCDAWGNYLRICPGREHMGYPQINFYSSSNRYIYPLDIYSVGYDGKDDVVEKSFDNFFKESIDFKKIVKKTYFDIRKSDIDDIVSWGLSIKKDYNK